MTDEAQYNPEMLVLARESARLSQADLADLVPYDQSTISRMESGQISLSDDAVRHFAKALGVPVGFFRQRDRMFGLGASFLFHRKRQTIPNIDLRKIEADVNIIKMQVDRLLRGIDVRHENTFAPLEVGLNGTPSEIADLTRVNWKLPGGPVRHLSEAVESAGGIIVYYPFHIQKVDGVSLWITGLPPIFVLNDSMPGDRVRWTLAHELGHVIMHRVATKEIEAEADQFATEFLMPRREIVHDLRDLTLPKAAALKLTWRASIQAIIRRARDLGAIPESKYKSLYVTLSKAGFLRKEPNPIDRERVSNMSSLISVHIRDNGYTIDDLAAMTNTLTEKFVSIYASDVSIPRLRLAQ
jgi:Zn-dependent peptidase ImmA (M78 family)/transcriptional regulator with XRE-family HTH domain